MSTDIIDDILEADENEESSSSSSSMAQKFLEKEKESFQSIHQHQNKNNNYPSDNMTVSSHDFGDFQDASDDPHRFKVPSTQARASPLATASPVSDHYHRSPVGKSHHSHYSENIPDDVNGKIVNESSYKMLKQSISPPSLPSVSTNQRSPSKTVSSSSSSSSFSSDFKDPSNISSPHSTLSGYDTMVHSIRSMSLTSPSSITAQSSALNLEDSIPYREWRDKRQEQIKEKERLMNEKHKSDLTKAQKEIEKFYDEYNRIKKKNKALNHEEQEKMKSVCSPTEKSNKSEPINWQMVYQKMESISKPKTTKDTFRMKNMIADLVKVNESHS